MNVIYTNTNIQLRDNSTQQRIRYCDIVRWLKTLYNCKRICVFIKIVCFKIHYAFVDKQLTESKQHKNEMFRRR